MANKTGELGERFVSEWLAARGWHILHRRWRCVWGEIDLIARSPSEDVLAFIEVKTRSQGNWDAGGLLAVTPQKQTKLCRAAALFLTHYPELAILPCRFDVALVSSQKPKSNISDRSLDSRTMESTFALHAYLEDAFEATLEF